MVVHETGVQMQTVYYSGRQVHRFIEKERIKAVIINEGFITNQCIYYMAFIVCGKDRLVLPFEVSRLEHTTSPLQRSLHDTLLRSITDTLSEAQAVAGHLPRHPRCFIWRVRPPGPPCRPIARAAVSEMKALFGFPLALRCVRSNMRENRARAAKRKS